MANPDPPPAATVLVEDFWQFFFIAKSFWAWSQSLLGNILILIIMLAWLWLLAVLFQKEEEKQICWSGTYQTQTTKVRDKSKNRPKEQIWNHYYHHHHDHHHNHHHQDRCSHDCSLEMRWLWPRAMLQLCSDVTLSHRPHTNTLVHWNQGHGGQFRFLHLISEETELSVRFG